MTTYQDDYRGNASLEENNGENSHSHVETVTPDNDNGPFDLIDNNRINGAMTPEDAGYGVEEYKNEDEDVTGGPDEDDEELIPIETDDDDDLDLDDDDLADDDGLDEDEDLDPLEDRPTTFEVDPDFASRDHGRTTGTMTDHEPGLPGSGRSGAYNL